MARTRLVWLVCLTILSVAPASATFQTYTTLEGWLAAATQTETIIDFSILCVSRGCSNPVTGPIGGVDFTSPSDQAWVSYAHSGWQLDWGTAQILNNTYSDNVINMHSLQAAWPTHVTAFAALMGINKSANGGSTWLPSKMDVKVWRDGAVIWETPTLSPLVTSAHPNLTFFGIVSTDPNVRFDSVTFTPNSTEPYVNATLLDDVRLGEAAASETPELGTGLLSLCGGILLAAGGFRRHINPS